jgi:transposase
MARGKTRGADEASGSLFSFVDLEERIPARHPLRKIRQVVNDALASLGAEFEALYTDFGRPSIAPERLIRASLIQILFSIRSERQLMEQMQYNLLFRWFVGLGVDDPVWSEGRLGIDPVDQFSAERAKPRADGRPSSPRTATGC